MTLAARVLAAALYLCAAAIHAAPDPDLQIYVDFDSYEPFWDHRSWMFHDRSPNGFDVEIGNLGWDLKLARGRMGRALECSWAGIGSVLTDGEPVYERGEGLTIAVWARLTGEGWVRPITVGSANSSVVEARITRHEGPGAPTQSVGWLALQDDGEALAFLKGVEMAVTNGWFHYAAVYNPASDLALVYLDGEEAARADVDGDPASDWGRRPPASEITIDVYSRGDGLVYVDELRMYSRALAPHEIRALMRPDVLLTSSPVPALATTWGALRHP